MKYSLGDCVDTRKAFRISSDKELFILEKIFQIYCEIEPMDEKRRFVEDHELLHLSFCRGCAPGWRYNGYQFFQQNGYEVIVFGDLDLTSDMQATVVDLGIEYDAAMRIKQGIHTLKTAIETNKWLKFSSQGQMYAARILAKEMYKQYAGDPENNLDIQYLERYTPTGREQWKRMAMEPDGAIVNADQLEFESVDEKGVFEVLQDNFNSPMRKRSSAELPIQQPQLQRVLLTEEQKVSRENSKKIYESFPLDKRPAVLEFFRDRNTFEEYFTLSTKDIDHLFSMATTPHQHSILNKYLSKPTKEIKPRFGETAIVDESTGRIMVSSSLEANSIFLSGEYEWDIEEGTSGSTLRATRKTSLRTVPESY